MFKDAQLKDNRIRNKIAFTLDRAIPLLVTQDLTLRCNLWIFKDLLAADFAEIAVNWRS
jgi:hypothetical protein